MSQANGTADERFEEVVMALLGTPGVTPPDGKRTFGGNALKLRGHIFAMLSRGKFTVKLPRERVAALVAAGEGEPFAPRPSHPMREWLTLSAASTLDWLALAREALAFAAAG